jgi:hypothetical protein
MIFGVVDLRAGDCGNEGLGLAQDGSAFQWSMSRSCLAVCLRAGVCRQAGV